MTFAPTWSSSSPKLLRMSETNRIVSLDAEVWRKT